MKKFLSAGSFMSSCLPVPSWAGDVAIVIHGGAGTILKAKMAPNATTPARTKNINTPILS